MSFFEYLKFLNLDKNTYILSLISKLTKLHILKKQTPKNIKLMHLIYLFICGLQNKYSIYLM